MSTNATGAKRTNTPSHIEDLYNREFITKAQRDAYILKDQKALQKANREAKQAGIEQSIKESMPTSNRRTSSTATNPANNHHSPSDSGAISRNARSASQKGQEKRATVTPSDRALLTFDSIRTTMEKNGLVRIQPFEVRNDKDESAILTFLRAVKKNTAGNHSSEWNKYQEALSKASKYKKDNDELELFDFQGDDEYEEVTSILVDLKKNPSYLGDVAIALNWIKDDGTIRTEKIGTGTKEMHLAITPDRKFEAFFKK